MKNQLRLLNGLGSVIAELILAAAAVYAINVWSTTKKDVPRQDH